MADDKGEGAGLYPDHVAVPMLTVERDERARRHLENLGIAEGTADYLIDQFGTGDHLDAWATLVVVGIDPQEAEAFLQRWGYWRPPVVCGRCDCAVDNRTLLTWERNAAGSPVFFHPRCAPWPMPRIIPSLANPCLGVEDGKHSTASVHMGKCSLCGAE